MDSTDKTDTSSHEFEPAANPGYVLGQLSAAFVTRQHHSDPATRLRAENKVSKWIKVLSGMISSSLQVGERTPVAGVPGWATLEVVRGGFATGGLLAEGPLQSHEQLLLARIGNEADSSPRAVLNSHFLGEEGIAELQRMLASGTYRITVPEEGTLLCVAWLLAHNQAEAALAILDDIGPFLDRLRFYPVPESRPLADDSLICLRTVQQVIEDLKAVKVSKRIQAEREATQIWSPLCDRAVALFTETIVGSVPLLQSGPDGRLQFSATGIPIVVGGWPCQRYPDTWKERARTVLQDYQRLRKTHSLCAKPERAGENFALLRSFLQMCVNDPKQLTGRDVAIVRRILAQIAERRGLPHSERCQFLRKAQNAVASRPTKPEIAAVVIDRLAELPQDEGLAELDAALAPISPAEAKRHGMEQEGPLPNSITSKVQRCLAAPVERLIELKLITSGEMLATVAPIITAHVRTSGIDDPDLRRLYGALYRAFRRRRSLLLLNLASQVKITELPWIKAIDGHRNSNESTQKIAHQTLKRVVTLTIRAFPQQILPNKLLQEIRALVQDAALPIPIVEELAADIFMDAFSGKFLQAAQKAANLLEDTLYERYYGISFARVRKIKDVGQSGSDKHTSPEFFEYCRELAGASLTRSSVARNGTIIEQAQILTTHNLAVFFDALDLTVTLRPDLPELAQRSFTWICVHLQRMPHKGKSKLRLVKNCAYAWRQMIFFVALQPDDSVQEFLTWATEVLQQLTPEFQTQFGPAMAGLIQAIHGNASDGFANPTAEGYDRRFLGWTTGGHWLLQ